MQGRLSPIVDGKIQSFPWKFWRNEFQDAKKIGLKLMEWTIDYENFYSNPLMTYDGRNEIINLSLENNVKIPSLTADCFMQFPFWKASNNQTNLQNDFLNLVDASSKIGIKFIILPLVDNGSLLTERDGKYLYDFLNDHTAHFKNSNIEILFESDFSPKKLRNFISKFNNNYFGINYDIGNSASLGFSIEEEFKYYGKYIKNVHVKDRLLRGGTVPLGEGNADFKKVFLYLKKHNYLGNLILQTARAKNSNHCELINYYTKIVNNWLI